MLMAHYRTGAGLRLPDNRPVSRRFRFVSRLTLWAFAAALVLKSAVPMLAAAAAGLQGKAVAEICDVYGVATMVLAARAADAMTMAPAVMPHHHGHERMTASAQPRSDAPPPGHHAVGHASDHCALTGMVAIATGDAPAVAALPAPGAPGQPVPPRAAAAFDAVARWAALLEHGPPACS
jgi:hypothetical protein